MNADVPTEIMEAAQKVEHWMSLNGSKRWELLGICSRDHASELKMWREGGLTEEVLRRNDGYIKVGRGCVIALEERLNYDPKEPLDEDGCQKAVTEWIQKGKYRSLIHRHDGTFTAVDESEMKYVRADTIPLLADELLNWPEGAEELPLSRYVREPSFP